MESLTHGVTDYFLTIIERQKYSEILQMYHMYEQLRYYYTHYALYLSFSLHILRCRSFACVCARHSCEKSRSLTLFARPVVLNVKSRTFPMFYIVVTRKRTHFLLRGNFLSGNIFKWENIKNFR